jgi:cytochrome P450
MEFTMTAAPQFSTPSTPSTPSSARSTARPDARAYPFGLPAGLEIHPMYRHLQEHEPLFRVRMPYGEDAWLVTRYEDTRVVLRDPRFSRSVAAARDHPRMTPEIVPLGLLDMDPPEHTRLRRLIGTAFTPRKVERLRQNVERIAGTLMADMLAVGSPVDLVKHFAVPLPITVICEILGVPYHDRGDFQTWTDGALSTTALDSAQRQQCFDDLFAYMAELVKSRRREPADDLLGELVRARDEGDRLSEHELTFLALTLLGAGYETTANQIGNFVHLLLTHPAQLALLHERRELIPGAVEEFLRFAPLGTHAGLPRYALEDVELSGGTVPAGDPVLTFTSVASRDPRVFPDPDRLDITRPITTHLGFGHGAHHCAGAQLARLELHVALGQILDHLPRMRPAAGHEEPRWKTGGLVRGPAELLIAW